jgi:hypothetical protein
VARTEVDGDLVTVYNVRDTRYPGIDQMETAWADWTVDLRELTNLWVMVGYFSPIRGIAHAEMIFEFSDSRNLLASFEIRPLKGQRYSVRAGFKNTFELTLRWANERDNLLRRVMKSNPDTEMHLLEFDITHRQMVDLFHAAARRTNQLADHPEWYNTATNACANNMVNLAHEILPGHLKKTRRVKLPGLMPKFWANQGLLKMHGTFEETMEAARINQRCLEIGDVDDFSAKLHRRV